jgi:hypothetical protein
VEVFERDAKFGGMQSGQAKSEKHVGNDLWADEAAGITQNAIESRAQMRLGVRRKRKVSRKSVSQLLVLLLIHGTSLS